MQDFPALQALLTTLTQSQIENLICSALILLHSGGSMLDMKSLAHKVAATHDLTIVEPRVLRKLEKLAEADHDESFRRIVSKFLGEFAHQNATLQSDKHFPIGSRWRYIGKGKAKGKIFSVTLLGNLGIVAESVPDRDYPPRLHI